MKAEKIVSIVDLIKMQKLTWVDALGNKVVIEDLKATDAVYEEALLRREELLETLANYDDAVMTKVLEEKPVSVEEIQKGIKNAITNNPNEVALVMCGSALKNRGIQPLIQAVVDYLPSPYDRLNFDLVSNTTGAVKKMKASNHKLVALAFKTMTHKSLGPLTYMRIYSGSIKAGVPFFNANR